MPNNSYIPRDPKHFTGRRYLPEEKKEQYREFIRNLEDGQEGVLELEPDEDWDEAIALLTSAISNLKMSVQVSRKKKDRKIYYSKAEVPAQPAGASRRGSRS